MNKIIIMCRISKETVIRANAKTKSRPLSDLRMSEREREEIVIHTRHCGVDYTHHVTVSELKASYSRSLDGSVK